MFEDPRLRAMEAAINALGAVRVLTELTGCEWKREGDWMLTRCMFHDDSDPSFKVGSKDPHRGRCFSCGTGGSATWLAQQIMGVGAREAVESLAQRFGIDESPTTPVARPTEPAPREESPGAPEVTDAQAHWLRAAFRCAAPVAESDLGRSYLTARGLAGADLRALAVVENGREWASRVQRVVPQDAWVDLSFKNFWTFIGRNLPFLLCGCTRPDGELVGFHVRRLTGDADERTPRWLFAGPGSPWPFVAMPPEGVDRLSPGHVVVCEGATDALAWSAAGFAAAGIPGTGGFRPWMATMLRGAFSRAIVATDADEAGKRAGPAWSAELRGADFEVCHVDLGEMDPACKDAGDYAASGDLVMLKAVALAARIDALPEPLREAAVERIEEAAGQRTAEAEPVPEPEPVPREREPTKKPTPRKKPVDDDDGDDDSPGGEDMTLDSIRARMKTTALEWVLVLVDQWWSRTHKGSVDAKLLGKIAIEWFLARGAVFIPDDTGEPYMYFEKHLHHCTEKDRAWIGFLYRVGGINRATKEGKIILESFQAYTWSQENAPRLQPWAYYDKERSELAVHTHDDEDRIVVVDEKGMRLVPNGSGSVLLRTDRAAHPVTLSGTPSVKRAAELLRDHFVANLATEDPERALVTCWVLSCWLRQKLNTRAMLFAQGSAGSGKSQAAKAATVLVFGEERLLDPTPAALRTEGAMQPLVALDNKESRNMDANLVQFLLLTASGGTKTKRLEGTTDGIHAESFNALIMLTAIEPAGIEELAQRTLTVRFKHEHQRPDYQPSKALRQLAKARSAILSGTWAIIAEMLSGRAKDKIRALRDLIPARHSVERLGEHLALMAYFADELRAVCPDIWGESRSNGADLLKCWLHEEAQIAHEKALHTDPIYAALTALMWSWNRVIYRHDDYVRPAVDENLYRCRPLYLATNGRLVPNPEEGTRFVRGSKREKAIGGFAGSYNDLHADLMRVSRESSIGNAYPDAIKNTGVLSARMAKNTALDKGGWHVQHLRATSEGRIYKFWADPDRIDAAGDELAIEQAAEAREAGQTHHAAEQPLPF